MATESDPTPPPQRDPKKGTKITAFIETVFYSTSYIPNSQQAIGYAKAVMDSEDWELGQVQIEVLEEWAGDEDDEVWTDPE
ncbi:MAG: hypothetical protein AAF571_10495 [Verrucomicrobiota bacterium]